MTTENHAEAVVNKKTAGNGTSLIEGGVDWLSMTLPTGSAVNELIYAQWCHIIAKIGREGHIVKPRSLLGYDGITAGNCFCGTRPDTIYLQLSGSFANEYYLHVYNAEAHISRIDVQATIWFDEERLDVAKEMKRDLLSRSADKDTRNATKWYIIEGSDGGDTIYVGSPTSRQRARIYNKSKQSEQAHYERAWRYEVTLKNDLAVRWAAETWGDAGNLPLRCVSTVANWLRQRGLPVPEMGDTGVLVLPKSRSRRSDVDQKLAWLGSQVRPTIAYLLECGYRDTLVDVLGLTDTA